MNPEAAQVISIRLTRWLCRTLLTTPGPQFEKIPCAWVMLFGLEDMALTVTLEVFLFQRLSR
jgi:hypothetical protein